MALGSPYRSLPVERRLALVAHAMTTSRDFRDAVIMRMVSRGGGFRPATLKTWSAERLAGEVVRRRLETPHDELQLLQTLYVELEPGLQIAFLDAAGVPHENGQIPEDLKAPLADAATVRKAAETLLAQSGDDARFYLHTIAVYNGEAWPGLAEFLGA